MAGIEIHDADDDLIEKASNGPHRDWEAISIEMEGARLQRLHDLVASPIFKLEDGIACVETVRELVELAESTGYADADAYENMTKDMTKDDIEREAVIQRTGHLLSNPEDSLYFSLVRASEEILIEAASTVSARSLLTQKGDHRSGLLFSSMLEAYEDGRHARLNTGSASTFAR